MSSIFYGITQSNAEILKGWSIEPYNVHTGIDIPSENVFSLTSGVVLAVGQVNKHYCVTIQYDVNNLLRYDNLSSVSVGAGDVVQGDTLIGIADKYVHFEYATSDQGSSRWSVRIGCCTYWKQNPHDIQVVVPITAMQLSNESYAEFTDGRGE